MPKFIVQRTVRHGDEKGKIKDHQPNSIIELTEEEAAALVECGAIVPIAKKEQTPSS